MKQNPSDPVADAMQRVLDAEREAEEQVAAAHREAEQIRALAREENRRIRFRNHKRIGRLQKEFSEATAALCRTLTDQASADAAAGEDEIGEDRLTAAVARLATRLTGGTDESAA